MSNSYKFVALSPSQILGSGLSVNRVLSVNVVPIFDLDPLVPNGVTDDLNAYVTDDFGGVVTSS